MDKTVPLGRVKGTLTPPCSKSYAQRALAASLLCGETSVLRNLEFCDDTRSALRCIETLGARVKHVDASTLSIEGGLHPRGKVLHVGESGLATRLFTPIASLCGMPVTIEGQGTLLRRPMHMMIDPLRRLGVRVRDNDGYLPFEVRGPIRGGEIDVDGSVSSQFITGLLLALPLSQHDTTLHVRSAVSTPYLDMTVDTAARFGVEICHNDYEEFYIEGGQRYSPACLSIEGDWSAAAMLLVAGAVAQWRHVQPHVKPHAVGTLEHQLEAEWRNLAAPHPVKQVVQLGMPLLRPETVGRPLPDQAGFFHTQHVAKCPVDPPDTAVGINGDQAGVDGRQE